jgi:hypothetical protein
VARVDLLAATQVAERRGAGCLRGGAQVGGRGSAGCWAATQLAQNGLAAVAACLPCSSPTDCPRLVLCPYFV